MTLSLHTSAGPHNGRVGGLVLGEWQRDWGDCAPVGVPSLGASLLIFITWFSAFAMPSCYISLAVTLAQASLLSFMSTQCYEDFSFPCLQHTHAKFSRVPTDLLGSTSCDLPQVQMKTVISGVHFFSCGGYCRKIASSVNTVVISRRHENKTCL